MKQFKQHIQAILDNGVSKPGRSGQHDTGDASLSLFARQLRFDLNDGLPFTTSKALQITPMLKELTWMLRGETNTASLGSKIWDKWAAEDDVVFNYARPEGEVIKDLMALKPELNNPVDASRWLFVEMLKYFKQDESKPKVDLETITDATKITPEIADQIDWPAFDKYLNDLGIKTIDSKTFVKKGDCGPIYGEQWRRFPTTVKYEGRKQPMEVDQLMQVYDLLLTQPDSRRIIVDAWNPGLLPKSGLSPTANVAIGNMSLPPCHMLFQFWKGNNNSLSLNLRLRSSDTGLGLGFNTGAYALLNHLYALEFNMNVGELVVDIADAHIYKGHIEGLKEYLSRPEHPLPKFTMDKALYEKAKAEVISKAVEEGKVHQLSLINSDSPEGIRARFEVLLNNITEEFFLPFIENYKSEPHIKLPLYD